MAKRAAAIKAVPSETPSPIEAVTPAGDPYAQRRQALLQQIDVAKKSLERESQSGFGDRSTKAAAYLEKLNTQLQQLDKEARAASPGQQAFHFAMNVGAIPAGMVIGGQLAKKVEAAQLKAVTARSKQLKDLAAQAKRLLASAKTVTPATARKLSAIVKTADTLKLARRSGPLSLATAGVLIGEGAYARFALGKQIDNETAAEVVRTTGTATAVAGTSLVAKRLMARATSLALPDAKAISMLEQARAVSSPALKAAEKTVAKKLAIKAGAKLLGGPLAIAFAAVDAIEGYQKDGLRGAILNAGTLGLYEGLKDARKVAKIQTRIVQHTMHTSPMMAKLRAAYHRGSGHPGQASLTSSNAPATVIVHEHRRKGASGKSETVRQYTRRAPGR